MKSAWIGLCAAMGISMTLSAREVTQGEMLMTPCFGCHAAQKRASDKIPFLRGDKPEHFVEEMMEFKSGEHEGTIMGRIARAYTEEEIRLMATYLSRGEAR